MVAMEYIFPKIRNRMKLSNPASFINPVLKVLACNRARKLDCKNTDQHPDIIKLLEEKTGNTLQDIGVGQNFLEKSLKAYIKPK